MKKEETSVTVILVYIDPTDKWSNHMFAIVRCDYNWGTGTDEFNRGQGGSGVYDFFVWLISVGYGRKSVHYERGHFDF